MPRSAISCTCFVFALLLPPGASQAVQPTPEADLYEIELPEAGRSRVTASLPLEAPAPSLPAAAATAAVRSDFATRYGGSWKVRWNRRTGTAHQVLATGAAPGARGAVLASAAQAEALARRFLGDNPDLFGTAGAELELVQARRIGERWSVVFQQRQRGFEVLGGRAHAVFDASGRVVAAGSDCHARIAVDPAPALSAEAAATLAERGLGFVSGRDQRRGEPELAILPLELETGLEYRLVYRVTLDVAKPAGLWETLVDASSGEILQRRNLLARADITGDVRGQVGDVPGVCAVETERPAANLSVDFDALGTALTAADGSFAIAGATGPTPYTAELEGAFAATTVCETIPGGGTMNPCELSSSQDAQLAGSGEPGVPLSLRWDGSNSRRDERTTYHWINAAHDEIRALDPTLTGIDVPIPAAVGAPHDPGTPLEDFCPGNAYYNSANQRITFCEAGTKGATDYANLGEIADVVVHEWAHFLTHVVYGPAAAVPSGDISEGNADILAMLMSRRPELAPGFVEGQCSEGIRNADNLLDIRYEWELGSGHFNGQILSGMTWDSWQALEASLGDSEVARAKTMELWHNGRSLLLPGASGPQSPDHQRDQVLGMFLADDDDGDLGNGTPHYAELCEGAARHGFEGPGPPCPAFDPPFPAQNLSLDAWVRGSELGSGADYAIGLSAYVSPSGREYAVIGLREAVGVVEVTDPANPVVVGPSSSCARSQSTTSTPTS
jgi:hypothetical protein